VKKVCSPAELGLVNIGSGWGRRGLVSEQRRGLVLVQGLIHISELSWDKVITPDKVVQVGDVVQTKVRGQ
jgi:S1 RNA binding domain